MTDSERIRTLNAAQNGDAEAFGSLYAEIAPELYRFALWYLKSPENAEDAVQEACLNAFKKLKSLKKPQAFKAWFFRILANCCKDQLAAGSRIRLVGDDDPALQNAPYYADFSDGYVEKYLDRLNAVDREIVLLSVLGEYKSGEIGQLIHMSATAVRSRLSRALRFLRTEMEADL